MKCGKFPGYGANTKIITKYVNEAGAYPILTFTLKSPQNPSSYKYEYPKDVIGHYGDWPEPWQ